MCSPICIGAQYSINSIRYKNGQTTFAEAPYVVLRNESMGKFLGKTATSVSGNLEYAVTFTSTETKKLSQGAYVIEIYNSSAMTILLKRVQNIPAFFAAASGSDNHQTPFS